MAGVERLSIWLLPAPALRTVLAGHIARIGRVLGSPPFMPHLTVLGDLPLPARAGQEAVAQLGAGLLPLQLAPRGIATAPVRFQALAVRFQPSPGLEQLAAALSARLGVPPAPGPSPHLSLAYPLPPFDPEALPPLATGLTLDPHWSFDALAVAAPGPGRTDWEDVAAWRVSDPYPS